MFFVLNINFAFSQKEANVWYFNWYCGLDFNTEPPDILFGFNMFYSSTCMSDSTGKFLFATNGHTVWNSNKQVMQNGQKLIGGGFAWQGVVTVQKPGSDNLYYIFAVPDWQNNNPPGLYYSVVDMDMDGGLGAVTNEKNIPLNAAWDAYEKVIAVRHANEKDIWIITRKHEFDSYAAFLLTENGIEDDPVISYSPDRPFQWLYGSMKISYNKKYLIAAYTLNALPVNDPYSTYDICRFDANTGAIDFLYTLDPAPFNHRQTPNSVEFSPDSKLVYLCNFTYLTYGNAGYYKIFQYDMGLIEDSAQFVQSGLVIADAGEGGCGLQLARDGQIYSGTQYDSQRDSLNVIHKPWVRGTGCDYEENVITFENGAGSRGPLPNFLLDYLYRFEWEGQCQSSPFQFQSNFQPVPTLIAWDFGDPASGSGNYSNDLNPVHYFTHAGEFEVSVYVKYPSGRVEQTSRVVTVEDIPHPNLGPGYVVCEGEQVTLYAGDEEGMYAWSTGEWGPGLNEITVSDSGWYWVQVTADLGCFGIDSVYVGWYPTAIINEDSLTLVPTTCGGSNGKILGLQVTGTELLSFEWYDADSTLLDTTLDLAGLTVGNYFLHILDGNGCTTVSGSYTIEDAGDIKITEVKKEDTRCGQDNGSITVTAAGAAEDLLYSVDNGTTWQSGNVFENLAAGDYFARARDPSGCEGVYADNPVTINDIAGPKVTGVTTDPEIDYLANGEIDITATVDTGRVYYSIDNGTTFQTDNGQFTNLTAGTYYCMVKDGFGCDTTFTVELERIISQLIEAIAGDGSTCIGNAAVVPLKLANFKDIFKFHVTLTYDTSILKSNGYIKVHPKLKPNLQVSIIPGSNEVIVTWQGDKPETLDNNVTMLELVFGAKKEGFTSIDWAAEAGESAFYNQQLEEVNAEYHLGILAIYTRPKIMMNKEEFYCEGDTVFGFVLVSGGSGTIDYFWEGPGGFTSTKENLEINDVHTGQAGIYTLTVKDTLDCRESKELNLVVYENPQIAFPDQDTIFAQPGFVLEAGSGYASYLWNTGDTADAIQVNNEGLYSVLVTSTESCRSSDSVMVLWGGEPFWLPNAFTPNGDGLNDEFKPVQRYDLVKTYRLFIYNRWGQLIFEASDINTGWDGTFKGQPAEQGTYVYKIVYTASSTGNEPQSIAGNVTLVR